MYIHFLLLGFTSEPCCCRFSVHSNVGLIAEVTPPLCDEWIMCLDSSLLCKERSKCNEYRKGTGKWLEFIVVTASMFVSKALYSEES